MQFRISYASPFAGQSSGPALRSDYDSSARGYAVTLPLLERDFDSHQVIFQKLNLVVSIVVMLLASCQV